MSGTGGWQHSGQVGDCRFEFSGVSVQRDGVPFAAAHANIASHEANHPPILPAGNGFGLAIPRAQRVRAHANNGPIRDTAACVDKPGSCSQASRTSRAARSFNSAGNFLPSGITPPCRGIRAFIKLRSIHKLLVSVRIGIEPANAASTKRISASLESLPTLSRR